MQGTTRLRRIADSDALEEAAIGEHAAQGVDEQNSVQGAIAQQQAAIDAQRKAAGIALQVALRTLSQKAIVALASLYSLLLAAAVFWSFMTVLPSPSVLQLVGTGMFSVFVVLLHLVRRSR